MILVVTAVTFLATVLIAMMIAYGLSSDGGIAVGRLAQLWNPSSFQRPKPMRERQVERAGQVLENLGKILPEGKGKQASRLNRLLVQAGFRKPNAALVFRGTKILLTALAVGAIYITGYYRQNQMALLFALALGFVLPDLWLNHRIRRRKHLLRLSLPDALDLLVICVEAGLGLDQAILRVSQELKIVHPELSEELRVVNLEMRVGKSRLDALRSLSERTGVDDIKALVAMLIQTERFGTSIAQSLRVHSDTLRTKRRQRAEEAAAKTPVKMVPVLVFFIFPALLVVILGPAIITLSRQLIPMMGG
jgi:tight adherence protein C